MCPPSEARPVHQWLPAAPAGTVIVDHAAEESEGPSLPTTVSDVSTFRDALAAEGYDGGVDPGTASTVTHGWHIFNMPRHGSIVFDTEIHAPHRLLPCPVRAAWTCQ